MTLSAKDVTFSYSDRPLIENVSLELEAGKVVGIVGPNGAGKTTLLNLLAGNLNPRSGSVRLGGTSITEVPRREIAKKIAVIPPEVQAPFAYSVSEVVEMGRYPHADAFAPLGDHDREMIRAAFRRTGLGGFEARIYNQLSSGERQRVVIARALAQEPGILLMDEPTVHLDIRFQIEIHDMMRGLAAEGLAVLVISHDLNLASIYCDELVLMETGRIVRRGTPAEVLEAGLLSTVYGAPLSVFPHPVTRRPTIWPETK